MAVKEVVRDMPSTPLAPVDETVQVPKSVRDAAARAEAYYQTPEATPDPAEAEAAAAEAARSAAAEEAANVAPAPKSKAKKAKAAAPAPVEPTPEAPPAEAVHENVNEAQWEHRYHSMKGRFDAAQQTIGSMQEQMSQLGDELMRTQQLITSPNARQDTPPHTTAANLITPQDEENYGKELIDLAQRAARSAVGQDIDAVKTENDRLKKQLQHNSQRTVVQTLNERVPNWQEINRDPRFINWLRLRDVYSGGVRKQMLSAAYEAADAPRVLAFFDGFIRDEAVAGNDMSAPQAEQLDDPVPVPRIAAVPLDRLAAPGRARPASGDTPGPVDKPVFTRTQISKFYNDVRRGAYAGRDAEKSVLEKQIFAAQNDGRVR